MLFEPFKELLAYATRKQPQLLILVSPQWYDPHHYFLVKTFLFCKPEVILIYIVKITSLQMGPFIDSEHPEIKKGRVDRTFDEIFHVEILRRVVA